MFCLFLALATAPALAGSSVTLTWNASAGTNVTGYRVCYGSASGNYTNKITVGNVTIATISGLVERTTYFFAVTACNALGLESGYSDEVSYTVPGTSPVCTVFFEAESGVVTAPMIRAANSSASGGQYVYSPTNEVGTVSFSLNITQASDYVVWCRVLSVDGGTDSLYVSVDNANEDVYDTMLSCSNLYSGNWTWTQVNGRTSGNPRILSLSAGVHLLTFRGRESSTLLDALYLTNDRSFVPPANAVNQAPTLNAIGNLTLNEDAGLQTVSLSGITSGSTNESQTLAVTTTSSNPALIPNPTVTYTSPNSTGSLRFTPVANANGTANVTVTVKDGAAQSNVTSRAFVVTVNPGDNPPTLHIAMAGQTVALSWSTNWTGYALESHTDLASGTAWNPVLSPPVVVGSDRVVTLTPSAPNEFYRLQKTP